MYEIIETDFSIFKDKARAIELFSSNDIVHKIILLYYTKFEVVALIEVPKKGTEYIYSDGEYTLPLSLDSESLSLYSPIFKENVFFTKYEISYKFAKQIARTEPNYFGLEWKDIPQHYLPTSQYQKSNQLKKYLPELTSFRHKQSVAFYDKYTVEHIKAYYQQLESLQIDKFVDVSCVRDRKNHEEYKQAYRKHLEMHSQHFLLAKSLKDKEFTEGSMFLIKSLYDLTLLVLRSIRLRRDQALEKLDEIYKQVMTYQWQYSKIHSSAMNIDRNSTLSEIMVKFGGIYNYRNRQYDYENIWDKRELNSDGSVKMSELETEIQKLFPDGCYPFSEYRQNDDLSMAQSLVNQDFSAIGEVDSYSYHPMWFLIMQCGENDRYYIDYIQKSSRPRGQIIHVTQEKIEVVAQNYLIFMEDIMIPKIEAVIEKFQKEK